MNLSPELFEYVPFYPERWNQTNRQMYAWEGTNIVLATIHKELEYEIVQNFIKRLDDGWNIYYDLIGKLPEPHKSDFKGKAVIAALNNPELTCGHGCGHFSQNGIEVCGFYDYDYPAFKKDPSSFEHYHFYEMGRCFYLFNGKFDSFRTGFAVFMRYVCMDTLDCTDVDLQTRNTIENLEARVASSDKEFYKIFSINKKLDGESDEKDNRFENIIPSDQSAMFASIMIYLWNNYGEHYWLKRFFEVLFKCPSASEDLYTSKQYYINLIVCASFAAKQNLLSVFKERWKFPVDNIYTFIDHRLKEIDYHGITNFDNFKYSVPQIRIVTPALPVPPKNV